MKSVSRKGRGTGETSSQADSSPTTRLSRTASLLALTALVGLTACDNDYTLAYVYAPSETTSTSGLINAYGIDNQTGSLRLLNDSPIPSGGRKPVALVSAPNQKFLYLINHDDSNVVEYSIGTDGKLYPQNTYNTTGSYPTSLVVSADGNFLYVAYTYQNGFTTASPGPGGISVFPVNADNSLGTPADFPIGRSPVAITVSSKATGSGANAVYVVTQDATAVNPASTGTTNQSLNLFAFAANSTSGALSILPGETILPGNVPSFGYATGISPSGILEDPAGTHLYVTDNSGNSVIGYSITGNGVPSPIASGSAPTGSSPLGLAIDPSGRYLYIANSGSGSISGYTFGPNGEPVTSAVAASTQAGTGTNCVAIEPSHGIYLYASGLISDSITGEQILTADGSLRPIINSPYAATTLPVCAISVARFP